MLHFVSFKILLKLISPLIILTTVYDSNTLYLDEEQQTYSSSEGIYMTQSYACGSVFTVSILDFLASAVCVVFIMLILLGKFCIKNKVSSFLKAFWTESLKNYQ